MHFSHDVVQRQTGAGGGQFGGNGDVEAQRARRGDAGAGDRARRVAQDVDADESGDFLKHVALGRAAGHAGEDVAGADVGMAGERHLGLWREDANAGAVGGVLGRQDEGRLGQVELAGDGLHLGVGQAGGVGEHRQGVAAEAAVGEDVDGDEVVAGHGGMLLNRLRMRGR